MVDFVQTAEQDQIVEAFSELLGGDPPVDSLRSEGQAGVRSAEWMRRLGELGWLGLGLPESDGGAGLGIVEELLLLREAGARLLTPAFLASLAAGHALMGRPDAAAPVISGERQVGWAVERGRSVEGARQLLVFEAGPGDLVLLSDGLEASLLAFDSLSEVQSAEGMDESLRTARATAGADAMESLESSPTELAQRVTVLAAAMLAGTSQAALRMSVEHAKTRHQFGQPIGAFQAIKHACADMAVRSEAAFSQVLFAALALEERRTDASFQVSAAKMLAGEAAMTNAEHNIQVQGGMGFTAESEAHHYLKRAHVLNAIGGSQRAHASAILKLRPAA